MEKREVSRRQDEARSAGYLAVPTGVSRCKDVPIREDILPGAEWSRFDKPSVTPDGSVAFRRHEMLWLWSLGIKEAVPLLSVDTNLQVAPTTSLKCLVISVDIQEQDNSFKKSRRDGRVQEPGPNQARECGRQNMARHRRGSVCGLWRCSLWVRSITCLERCARSRPVHPS